jgi:hypothetical protein
MALPKRNRYKPNAHIQEDDSNAIAAIERYMHSQAMGFFVAMGVSIGLGRRYFELRQ